MTSRQTRFRARHAIYQKFNSNLAVLYETVQTANGLVIHEVVHDISSIGC